MSVMEERPARRRRSFTAEFKADAVALVIDEDRSIADVARSLGLASRPWGTGSVRPGSIGVNARDSPRANVASWLSCAGKWPGFGWNENCSNERRPSG